MPINFRPFRNTSSANRTPPPAATGPAKVPDKAPQLPPLNLNPSNPHGLQRAEGGRRNSIDRPNPEMTQFWNNQNHPPAFDNNQPLSGGMEALHWKVKNNEMGRIWGKEERAINPSKPSAMEMHRRMQEGPDSHSPLLEDTVKSMPKASRDFFNNTHSWTSEDLRKEMTPKKPETFGNWNLGRAQQEAQAGPSERQEFPRPPVPPASPRSPSTGSGSFQQIVIPDLPG